MPFKILRISARSTPDPGAGTEYIVTLFNKLAVTGAAQLTLKCKRCGYI
jgi:hypothetical protein